MKLYINNEFFKGCVEVQAWLMGEGVMLFIRDKNDRILERVQLDNDQALELAAFLTEGAGSPFQGMIKAFIEEK